MRLLLTLLVLLVGYSANAQALWRNFFTTNQNPRVTVAAGSNVTVQASTVGVDQRIFTVNSVPPTNVLYSTNASNATNFWGVLDPTNLPTALNYISNYNGLGTNTTFYSNVTVLENALGTTITPRVWLTNGTSAALGAQQVSPAIMLGGQGWRSGTSATMPVQMGMYVLPVQGSSANPKARLYLISSVNNAAPSSASFYFDSDGNINSDGGISLGLNASVSSSRAFVWSSRSEMFSSASGLINCLNSAETGFIGFILGPVSDNWLRLKVEASTNNPTFSFRTGADGNYASTVHSNITAVGNIGVTATNFVLSMPQWVDMIGSVLPGSGVAEPVPTAITNGSVIKAPGFQLTDEEHYAIQLPHNIAITNASFVLGTNVNQWHVEPHIHYMLTGATVDATHSNVTWQIEWAVTEINGDIKAQGTNSVTQGVSVNGRHYLAEFGPITNAGPYGISSMFNARLTRQSSASQELAPNGSTRDVVRLKFDLHVPVGNVVNLGSRGETSQ